MDHKYVGVTPEQFHKFSTVSEKGPLQMLNLLKFKDKVEETGTTGEEAYALYMQAVVPFFQQSKAKIIYQGRPVFGFIGPSDDLEWDKVLIVEYATKEDFLNMITAEGYPAKLRSQALEDSRLILCKAN